MNILLFKLLNWLTVNVYAETEIGQKVRELWDTQIYKVIKEVGGTLAIATFVCSAFYYFILGKKKNSTETAHDLMVGSGIGIAIIYLAPTIINTVIGFFG